nr:hypothetical protein [Acidobacteriota bacterium]
MAEERNLATVRAPESPDEDVTKAELQRRMEEARESITQTVTEIKDSVANQYQAVRESFTDALDWREQFRKRPIAFSVGALSVGFIVGYSIAGTFKGDDSYDEDEEYGLSASGASTASSYYRSEGSESQPASAARSYAAQGITGGSYGSSSDYDTMSTREPSAYSPPPSTYSGLAAVGQETSGEAEDQGPGLIERFKSTKAYDRLEEEVSSLGDRFINELSKTAQSVVLPALFGKVKELFGVDISNKESEGRTSQRRAEASSANASSAANASLSGGAQSSFAGVNRGATGGESDAGSSSYATS